jgi:ATP-dependent 26S proteasome regulatory subunit
MSTAAVVPDFITAINNDYRSQISHVFLLHGNIYDFVENTGSDSLIEKVFCGVSDDEFIKDAIEADLDRKDRGVSAANTGPSHVRRILATYNMSQGLEFPNPHSYEAVKAMLLTKLTSEKVTDTFMRPKGPAKLIEFMNIWFELHKERTLKNEINRKEKKALIPEILMTWLIQDADAMFPNGDMTIIGGDRINVVSVRQWAQDVIIGARNKIILMTRYASDLHSSIRSEISTAHLIRKPNLADRLAFIKGYDASIQKRAAESGGFLIVGNNKISRINWAPEFDAEQCAIQSAGMNRKQLRDTIMHSWIDGVPLDYRSIMQRKQRALQDEYNGILDFKEPTFGFENIGGHDHFKSYCWDRIVNPLKSGDIRSCSMGAIMLGPPGTGKSMLALALAKEAKMNFMNVDLGKVFAGLVGETEKNMRKLLEAIEAAAPCIVFCDEIDTVMASGRSGAGDSGTSGRVFGNFMTFLSDGSRQGRIVVLLASNRPDLLDSALIRDGRIDLKVPILPPSKGDAVGRKAILQSLTTKHKVKFAKSLGETMKDPNNGLGRLLLDEERIWTGAEIESLVKKAMVRASMANRKDKSGEKDYTIREEDWNHAMNVILPSTGEVDTQINLALRFVNDLDYCPPVYWDQVKAEQKKHAALMAQLAEAA